jgi:CHAT domain-containing protein
MARQARHRGHEAKALMDRAKAELASRDTGSAAVHARGGVVLATAVADDTLLFDALDVLAQVQVTQADLNAATESINRALALPAIKDDHLFYGYLDRADIYLGKAEGCHQKQQKADFDVCLQALDRCRADYRKAAALAKGMGWSGLEQQCEGFIKGADQRAWLIGSQRRSQEAFEKADLFHPKVAGDVLVTEHFATGGAAPPPAMLKLFEGMKQQQAQAGGFAESSRATLLYVEGLQHQMAGNHDGALAAFLKATDLLERDRLSLHDESSRGAFLEDKTQIYVDAIRELLDRRRFAEAFALMERSRARAITDLLAARRLGLNVRAEQQLYAESVRLRSELGARQTELARLINAGASTDQIAPSQNAVLKLEDSERALDDRMAREAPRLYHLKASQPLSLAGLQAMMKRDRFDLLEYLVTETALILWHIGPDVVHVRNVFVPRTELTRSIAALRGSLVSATVTFDRQRARELYLQLLQPARGWVSGNRLVIVPHDVLNGLPMQVLEDPVDGSAAGERWQLSYAPSATIYADLKTWASGPNRRVLAVADPDIAASEIEMAALEKIYPGRYRRLGGEALATEANVKTAVGGFDVVHLSVHGHFNAAEPMLSYLSLAAGGGDDGHLTAAEMFGLPLGQARLVVLSACETARTEVGRSNEILGITRGLLYAGAGALVLSYWSVDADSTALWMESFHRAAQTTTLAEAAQRALQAVKTTPAYAHPFYWGAFSLIARQ